MSCRAKVALPELFFEWLHRYPKNSQNKRQAQGRTNCIEREIEYCRRVSKESAVPDLVRAGNHT